MGSIPIVTEGKLELDLQVIKSFRYEPYITDAKGFTARNEKGFWYGYRKVAGKLRKRYISKTSEVSVKRLEQVALELDNLPSPNEKETKYATSEEVNQLRIEVTYLREEIQRITRQVLNQSR